MSSMPYSTVAAVRNRLITLSLVSSLIIGTVFLSLGGNNLLFAAVIITATVSALISFVIIKQLISGIRFSQLLLFSKLLPDIDLDIVKKEKDDLRIISALAILANDAIDYRQNEHKDLLNKILEAQQELKTAIPDWLKNDEKETTVVRDAVIAIELLNSSYSVIIDEIEELSGRTDERASISAEMSATTDAIAENINNYSNYVLETSGSIEQMARATHETAENIRALSESTEQTVASINMISNSQSSVRENSELSATVSENVRVQAQQGLRSMVATMKAMQEIANSSDESFESINRLSRYSAKVGDFLRIIQEVVEQTNLLSLNASIIAAQAGSRGRAFAVVAEEVRSLARRTSASTKEIEELVRNIQKETASVQRTVTQGKDKVKQGVKISNMANEALEVIYKSSEGAVKMVSNIAAETTEQASNINRITEEAEKNLERVRQITIATEQQQQSSTLIMKNIEQMRELAQKINSSAQEQAKGNRLYLRSVMEENDRTKELNNQAAYQINLADRAVDAARSVESLILTDNDQNRLMIKSVVSLIDLIEIYKGEATVEPKEDRIDSKIA